MKSFQGLKKTKNCRRLFGAYRHNLYVCRRNTNNIMRTNFFKKTFTFTLYLALIFIFSHCVQNEITEKHYNVNNHMVNVHDQIKEIYIPEEDILIGSVAFEYFHLREKHEGLTAHADIASFSQL